MGHAAAIRPSAAAAPRCARCGGRSLTSRVMVFPVRVFTKICMAKPRRAPRLPDLLAEWRRPERAPLRPARGFQPRRRKGREVLGTTAPGVPRRRPPRCGMLGVVVSPPPTPEVRHGSRRRRAGPRGEGNCSPHDAPRLLSRCGRQGLGAAVGRLRGGAEPSSPQGGAVRTHAAGASRTAFLSFFSLFFSLFLSPQVAVFPQGGAAARNPRNLGPHLLLVP